jgi:transcription initiation factor TFIID subunit 9B
MASPAPDAANGISTPPGTTTNGHAASPPQSTAPASQPAQPATTTTTAAAAAAAPTTSYPSTSLTDTGTSKRPRDARLIHLLLANMGVHAYTERVPLQLLDFAYRYTSSILSDALAYEPPVPTHSSAAAAKKRDTAAEAEGVSLNALRTAVQGRATQQFQHALGKEFMADLAAERNRIALPRVDREFGLRLPPERYCFTGVGWAVRGAWEDEVGSEDGGEEGAEGEGDEEMDVSGATAAAGGLLQQGGDGGEAEGKGEDADTEMGGMDEVDEDEFEEAMGTG